MHNFTENRASRMIAVAAVVALALGLGIAWGLTTGGDGAESTTGDTIDGDPVAGSTASTGGTDADTVSTLSGTDTSTEAEPADPEPTDTTTRTTTGSGGGSSPPTASTGRATLSAIELVSLDRCEATVQPQVSVSVTSGTEPTVTVDSGVLPPSELANDEPVTILGRERFPVGGDDWTVQIFAREHYLGAMGSQTNTTPGRHTIDAPANNSHRDWQFTYEIVESGDEILVHDVELHTLCEETVVPQVLLTVDRGDGAEILIDVNPNDQRTLASGRPLTLTDSVDLGELGDDWTVRILINEHYVGRQYQAAHTASEVVDTEVPGSDDPPGPWRIRYSLDAG